MKSPVGLMKGDNIQREVEGREERGRRKVQKLLKIVRRAYKENDWGINIQATQDFSD